MIETINGKAYLKKGDKVYELGGGSNIITADSVEQLPDPASVPEGTIALVKSEGGGGGGLPVVTITTEIAVNGDPAMLSTSESAALSAAMESHMPAVISVNVPNVGKLFTVFTLLANEETGNSYQYYQLSDTGTMVVAFMYLDGNWVGVIANTAG